MGVREVKRGGERVGENRRERMGESEEEIHKITQIVSLMYFFCSRKIFINYMNDM